MIFSKKYSGRIIDIHSHILPMMDDGSKDMQESLDMMHIATDEGITDIICTPHFKNGHHNASFGTVYKRVKELQ